MTCIRNVKGCKEGRFHYEPVKINVKTKTFLFSVMSIIMIEINVQL